MIKKIFLDANILVDLINEENKINGPTIYLFNRLCDNNDHLYCSPTSFAITYYFLSKVIRNEHLLNEKSIRFFSQFQFTREDNGTIDKVKKSKFRDLEDALQYYSAEDSKMDVIITNNFFDFEHSQIPVYHPIDYINQFLL